MDFSIELPLNQTGLGQVGIGVAVEIFSRNLYPNIFCIGDPNFQFTNLPEGFQEWFKLCTSKALRKYDKDQPGIKIWHIEGSQARLTNNMSLYTVSELDGITAQEKNIMGQYSKVLVPSNYSKQIFEANGLNPCVYCPNFYDTRVFSKVEVQRKGLEEGEVTIFGIFGKMEKRKRTVETIRAWARKFGGDKKYRLNALIFNHFFMNQYRIDPKFAVQAHRQYIEQEIGTSLPWNITIHSYLNKEEYNLAANAIDIDLSLSGGEGFGLPTLTSRVLGKRGVALKAHSFVDFCSDENTTWVNPSGKEECYDGIFFHKGHSFNQGSIFCWNEDEAISAMEEAVGKEKPDPKIGEDLAEKFSAKRTVDILLDGIN